MAEKKWVYSFGDGKAEGAAEMRNLLGGKGANLAEMSNIGLPVPPGFTITTEVCTAFYENDRQYPDGLKGQVEEALARVGKAVGMSFGDPENPLLVSVRSGARASMPGMMDTVLNLGLNDETAAGLAKRAGDERFAYDSYRRFISMYSDVVLGVEHHNFEEILEYYKEEQEYNLDTELSADDWKDVIARYKERVEEELGRPFPQDVNEQIWGAIGAVFGSWGNRRAETYRRLHNIPESWGTAVNIQAMVFGNMGETSATGVAFTRNPSTGEKAYYGEFLVNAQGEDVVAGIRTPQSLTKKARIEGGDKKPSMEEAMPEAFAELAAVFERLEKHYTDMQDVEFTVQEGKLWMLQTRSGKRTAKAALKIAVDMVAEGLISEEMAIGRVDPASLDQLLHPTLDPDAPREVIATGLPASPGAASGEIVFSSDEAAAMRQAGKDVVLVRVETSPEDINGMHSAVAILTTRGGMTSHAAVVARGMGRPCVSGAGSIRIDYKAETMTVAGVTLQKGEVITVDGSTGQVIKGRIPTLQPELSGDFATLMEWADRHRRMEVRTNAETPHDAETARKFGAEGIGLCRTEHMFFEEDRIVAVRQMIVAADEKGRRAALEKILPMQRDDFRQLFEIMHGLPVTIRLLDPPLHEFLPKGDAEIEEFAREAGMDAEKLRRRLSELEETNPMLGHRGCRLGISYPEIYEMQARAIFEGAALAAEETGAAVIPEIMIPLVGMKTELDFLKARIVAVAAEIEKEKGAKLEYTIGTMIELPRAALMAREIAESAEFFSFGTNDLTQTTFGISRDDAAHFLNDYMGKKILAQDPFVSLDRDGVGELVKIGAERGRETRPDIKLGICGEHGGDPASIAFCEEVGLTYVSCSPYRVPIARLAAAQSAISGAKYAGTA
ncbi:pyruvate, phosphate dikinase [Parvibaculum sp.]|jgi:pyruvate,orthophosphate dikinase|uniref:pyruvate, phosphate dikinase n=1 Tax=Parvibaculum sp. TaxID=2024848 RepID=UPI000C620A98|nr:pyruvate, phosphate dikinase [Parvibaculum sp.]MAU62095.1 pyruvate, phosphate dikinase [Parvibaculum sp.]MBO6666986.1 pyruvate, phosphate dikinase [Parvibaculum sp.]MBO6690430.1 pyruvate, phosphate dikinase [Parvibaculum sp.]MBO6713607.1 pyruvate, phosphate dikinase [Parvibaculum sp.]|tara:strand:+ start:9606 stop:12293 length:2688 start_codon:yes stop_codon:yes gene_type:complete